MPDLPPLVALLLPPLGIPSLIDLAKVFAVPVALALLARHLTRRDKARDEAVAAATRAGQETSNERKVWREARLTAEKTNADAITKEHADRVFWQLENAADWARVVVILTEFGEVQRQLAVVASTSSHHETELSRLNARLDEMTKHLNEFIMRHVKPANT